MYISYVEPKLNNKLKDVSAVSTLGNAKALNTRLSIRRHTLECKRHETVFSTAVEHVKQGSECLSILSPGWQQQNEMAW